MENSKKYKTNLFINKAKLIHNDSYDYSMVEYINNYTNIRIICYKCGKIFTQTPKNHLKGCKCSYCSNKIVNTETFINKAKLIHNDSYDYSIVEYEHSKNKIDIICIKHGLFKQTPNEHLSGNGCPVCRGGVLISKESWLQKVYDVHYNLYDYSLVDYINTQTKVKIICKTHGIFEQKPNDHQQGKGCPICKLSKGELKIKLWLTDNNITFSQQHKFDNCKGRYNTLPFDFYLPEHNTCIEFDGKQHFEIVHRSKDKNKNSETFIQTCINDNIKDKFCNDYNIHLIRISYLEYKNIQSILEEFK
jgi:DNA-directed RNA polymerase subunit RPC12/RpoP/very-short-patch-repair endonuclease